MVEVCRYTTTPFFVKGERHGSIPKNCRHHGGNNSIRNTDAFNSNVHHATKKALCTLLKKKAAFQRAAFFFLNGSYAVVGKGSSSSKFIEAEDKGFSIASL